MILRAWAAALALAIIASNAAGQSAYYIENASTDKAASRPSVEQLRQQLDEQARQLADLQQQLEKHTSFLGIQPDPSSKDCTPSAINRVPLVAELAPKPVECDESEASAEAARFRSLKYFTDYDRGFVIRPFDSAKNPFEMRINGWIQFRHHAFARDVTSWTDNAGVTREVRNRNALDIERARLLFSGYAIDERLTYFLQLDGDTDNNHTVDFFDYFWAWEFNDQLQLQVGKRKVPGSRQWILTARDTRFIDRPVANDFFRPDRTVGVFAVGSLGDTGHYELMVGNGFNTTNLTNAQTDNRFTYAATTYVDPFGDYGRLLTDFEPSSTPLARIGHSFVFSPLAGRSLGDPFEEAEFVRLSDGTRLTQTGALTPGVTVSDFDIYYYAFDAAFKWRGWSWTNEVCLRWINDFNADGAVPIDELYQRGFYSEGGYFLIPKKFDVNARYSQVTGEFGTSSEYAAGFNYYPLEKSTMKLSFDVTVLDGSPLQNTTSDILAGDDGVLYRTQFQAEF